MAAHKQAENSLFLWMLESPLDRLGKGLILPILLLFGLVAALVYTPRTQSDIVLFDPRSGKVVKERVYAEDTGTEITQERLRITYWEKWSGFEGQAIRDAVDEFNRVQDKLYVELTIQGDITQKTRIAIEGGDPPDLAGLYSFDVPVFATQGALLPLDGMMAKAGISRTTYVPVYYDLCVYAGRTWALPTTPSTWALHWNKKLFREAGLDPDRPPRTIEELDAFADKLTKRDKDGRIVQIGYLPTEPGWWKYPWALWFGGTLWDGRGRLTFDTPESVRAMEWIKGYTDRYGYAELDRFKKTFGDFSSSDNAFFTGKVAMEMQGVWMAKFIGFYAPKDFEWGVAPFPAAADPADPSRPILENVSVAEADVIGIPRGARHPEEAFEFIRFMATPKGMEILCLGQGKHSPLRETSADWHKNHPHPHIRVFEALADSPNCFRIPPIGVWNECSQAWGRAFDDIWSGKKTPRAALAELQAEMQRRLDHELRTLREQGIRFGE